MRRLLIVVLSGLVVLAGSANAFIVTQNSPSPSKPHHVESFASGKQALISWAGGMSDIYAAGGLDVTLPGSEHDTCGSIADPFGGTVSFSGDVEQLAVPTSWATWSHGYQGPVLSSMGADLVRLDFDASVSAFGFYAEPNKMRYFDITLGLSDGRTATKSVSGDSGAKFFGFTDSAIDWLEISCYQSNGFAFGEMVMARDAVPEPGTLMLLGLGLAGFGALRRRMR